MTDLAEIEAALKAAKLSPLEIQLRRHRNVIEVRGPFLIKLGNLDDATEQQAHLIANAPAWLAELVERVKAAEAEVERATWAEGSIRAELDAAEATIARVRELAESVPKTITFNPSDAAYLSGQVDFAESVLDALNHTDCISPGPVLIDEVHRFTSVNSAGADDTTLRARVEDATEPILRPTDQRYEPPADDHESGCCR